MSKSYVNVQILHLYMTKQILRLRTFRPYVDIYFKELFVEDIGVEPMTPSLQS